MKVEIIDYDLDSELKKLADFAEKNPFSMDDILDVYNRTEPAAGDREGYFFITPFGMKVVYSIEHQVKNIRHLSVSMLIDYALPPISITKMVMKVIGFKNKLEECQVEMEDISDKRRAVNVWEIIENE
jgi:hypothetical protein